MFSVLENTKVQVKASEKPKVNIRERRDEFIGFFLFFYLFPILLMTFRVVSVSHNVVLVLMGLVMLAYVFQRGIAPKSLGFRSDNLKKSFFPIFTTTIIICGGLLFANKLGLIKPQFGAESFGFYLFYLFVSAPLQEFIFRSLMIYELKLFFNNKDLLIVFLSALIFSFSHLFYGSTSVLISTFLMGLIWGYVYQSYPNFYALAFSHAVIGAVSLFIGVV